MQTLYHKTLSFSRFNWRINNETEEKGLGIRSLAYCENGFRNFFTVKPISSYKDLSGKKIRVSDTQIISKIAEAFGATPTTIYIGDVWFSLIDNNIDGAEQSIFNYMSNAFMEIAPYLLLDDHTIDVSQIAITDTAWEKLSPAQQGYVIKAATYASEQNKKNIKSAEEQALTELKQRYGVTVIECSDEDKAAMAELCATVISSNLNGQENLYNEIKAMK